MEYYTLLSSTHDHCNADRQAPLVTVASVSHFSSELLDGQVVSRIPASTPLEKRQGRKGDGEKGRWGDGEMGKCEGGRGARCQPSPPAPLPKARGVHVRASAAPCPSPPAPLPGHHVLTVAHEGNRAKGLTPASVKQRPRRQRPGNKKRLSVESGDDCGAAVPAARKVGAKEGTRDARTTIVAESPKKIRARQIVPSGRLARTMMWRDCHRSKSSRGIDPPWPTRWRMKMQSSS